MSLEDQLQLGKVLERFESTNRTAQVKIQTNKYTKMNTVLYKPKAGSFRE